MKREIKFRAWDTEIKEMFPVVEVQWDVKGISGYTVDCESGTIGTYNSALPDIKIMQFTGLLDKNGTEIYEGCVVRFWEGEHREYIEKVYFDNGAFGVRSWRGIAPLQEYMTEDDDIYGQISCAEVIGNIYENPELLKKTPTN